MNTDCAVIWSLSFADINMYVGGKLQPCIVAWLRRFGKQNPKSKYEAWIKDEEIMFYFYFAYCGEYKNPSSLFSTKLLFLFILTSNKNA